MFVDAPMLEAGAPAIYVVAQAQSPQAATQSPPNKLGACNEYRANASHSVSPIFAAEYYINQFKKGPNVLIAENGGINIRLDPTIGIAKAPNHGVLERYKPDADKEDLSKYDYLYVPDKDYVGEDNFQFDVAVDGKTLRVYYQIKVFPEDENPNYVGFCNWEKYYWKISTSSSQLFDLATMQRNETLSALLADASQALTSITNLPGAAIGQTIGEGANASITLRINRVRLD